MTDALLFGSLVGFFSGIVPGPYSGLVAATALDQGFRAGFKLALIPLLSEGAVLAVTAVVISQLPSGIVRWMGIAGGLLVIFIGRRTYRDSKARGEGDIDEQARRVRAACFPPPPGCSGYWSAHPCSCPPGVRAGWPGSCSSERSCSSW